MNFVKFLRTPFLTEHLWWLLLDLLLYIDDTGLIFQHKDINIIEQQLNRNFSNTCDWFVDNRLSIHFGEDKTKSILFVPLNKCKELRKLNISYGSLKIKQYSEVTSDVY